MSRVFKRFWLASGIVALVGSIAVGGQRPAVLSIVIAEKNGVSIDVLIDTGKEMVINPAARSVQAAPGDIVKVEVWARCWTNASGGALKGYQATFPYETYFTGDSGNVLPVDFESTTDPTGQCPFTPNGSANPGNVFVDVSHPAYVFRTQASVVVSNSVRCNYRLGAASASFGVFGLCPVSPPQYGATLILEVSPDASGTFAICLDDIDIDPTLCGPDNTFLSTGFGEHICNITFECATISVVADPDPLCPGEDDTIDNDANGIPDCLEKIPTVSAWGLVIMTLLLLVAGKVYFGRRRSMAV